MFSVRYNPRSKHVLTVMLDAISQFLYIFFESFKLTDKTMKIIESICSFLAKSVGVDLTLNIVGLHWVLSESQY